MITYNSNGLVRVPHQVMKTERPTVSISLARAPTPIVSSVAFSTNRELMNYILELVANCLPEDSGQKKTYTGSRGSGKNESTEIGRALVAKSSGSVDESTNTV